MQMLPLSIIMPPDNNGLHSVLVQYDAPSVLCVNLGRDKVFM